MKNIGSKSDFAVERLEELMKGYDEYLRTHSFIRIRDLFTYVVGKPTSRFWVSEGRAIAIVYAIMRGESLDYMRGPKKRMFLEIYKRVVKMREANPKLSVAQATSIVILQPAPEFYLAPSSAKIMIYRARKNWIKKKMRNIYLCRNLNNNGLERKEDIG